MAAEATVTDVKLQLKFYVTGGGAGGSTTRTSTFSALKLAATDDQLYAAGNAIASLVQDDLAGLNKLVYSALTAGV